MAEPGHSGLRGLLLMHLFMHHGRGGPPAGLVTLFVEVRSEFGDAYTRYAVTVR